MWPKHTLQEEHSLGSLLRDSFRDRLPFLAWVLPVTCHWQVPLLGDASALPAQTLHQEVAVERVSVFPDASFVFYMCN